LSEERCVEVAVVLAGRRNDGHLQSVSSEPWEALIDVAGRPMAARVVDALVAAGVGEVVVVGPDDLAPHLPAGARVVAPGRSLLENLERGLEASATSGPVLVATGDIPLLEAEHVRFFLTQASSHDNYDLAYSIVPRSAVEAVLPGVRRTYVRLAEGTFTGGNLLSLRPAALPALRGLADRVVSLRKAPWRLAGLLGPWLLVRFLLGRVRLAEAEERFSRLGEFVGRAVVVPYAAVGVDVDKASDYALCERWLSRRVDGSA
jgi:molybdopterin-guanine dinucleotide biosynthesis protein A